MTTRFIENAWKPIATRYGFTASYYRESTTGTVDEGYPLTVAAMWIYGKTPADKEALRAQPDGEVKKTVRKCRMAAGDIPTPDVDDDYLAIGGDYWAISGVIDDPGGMLILELTRIDSGRKGKMRISR